MSLSPYLDSDEPEQLEPATATTEGVLEPSASTAGCATEELVPGDVILFARQDVHALLRAAGDYSWDATDAPKRPSRMDVEWLDGYAVGDKMLR